MGGCLDPLGAVVPDKLLLAEGFHAPHLVIGTHVQIPFPVDAQRQFLAFQRIVGRYQFEPVLIRIGKIRWKRHLHRTRNIRCKTAQFPGVAKTAFRIRKIGNHLIIWQGIKRTHGSRNGKGNVELQRLSSMADQSRRHFRIDAQAWVVYQHHIVHPHLVAFHHFAKTVARRETQQQIGRIGGTGILYRSAVTHPLPAIVLYLDISRTYQSACRCISIGPVLEFAIIMQVQRHIPVPATVLSQLGPEHNGIGTTSERPAFGPVTGIRIDTRRTIPLIIIIIQYPRSQSSHIFIRTCSKRELIMVPR